MSFCRCMKLWIMQKHKGQVIIWYNEDLNNLVVKMSNLVILYTTVVWICNRMTTLLWYTHSHVVWPLDFIQTITCWFIGSLQMHILSNTKLDISDIRLWSAGWSALGLSLWEAQTGSMVHGAGGKKGMGPGWKIESRNTAIEHYLLPVLWEHAASLQHLRLLWDFTAFSKGQPCSTEHAQI